jgi:beta-lactamase regulating signal transducer with metallopeptidase domain
VSAALVALDVLAVGTLGVAAGGALAWALARAGRPTRFAWAAALALAVGLPAARAARAHAARGAARPIAPVTVVAPAARAPLAWIVVRPRPALAAADRVLGAAWAASSALALAWVAGGALRLARARRRWRPARVDGVPVRVSDADGPAVVGWRRPTIVVPRWALALPDDARALLLAHERAHADAGDVRLLAAATLAVALAPWHPALWWALGRLRAAVELDCDARVLASADTRGRRRAYATLLLDVGARAIGVERLLPGAVAFGRPPSLLARRITAMTSLPPRPAPARVTAAVLAAGALAASGAALPAARVAALQPPARARAADTTKQYLEFQVDETAALVPGTLRLRWPEGVRHDANGTAVAQFVVEPSGRVRRRSVRVIESTMPAFADAAVAALGDTTVRFTPARVGGRPVAQLVQFPFAFAPDPAAPRPAPRR